MIHNLKHEPLQTLAREVRYVLTQFADELRHVDRTSTRIRKHFSTITTCTPSLSEESWTVLTICLTAVASHTTKVVDNKEGAYTHVTKADENTVRTYMSGVSVDNSNERWRWMAPRRTRDRQTHRASSHLGICRGDVFKAEDILERTDMRVDSRKAMRLRWRERLGNLRPIKSTHGPCVGFLMLPFTPPLSPKLVGKLQRPSQFQGRCRPGLKLIMLHRHNFH